MRQIAGGVPAFALANTAIDGRFRIDKTMLADPRREVLLQRVLLTPLHGRLGGLPALRAAVAALVNRGADNTAWLDDFKGLPMLFARGRGPRAGARLLGALARPFRRASSASPTAGRT